MYVNGVNSVSVKSTNNPSNIPFHATNVQQVVVGTDAGTKFDYIDVYPGFYDNDLANNINNYYSSARSDGSFVGGTPVKHPTENPVWSFAGDCAHNHGTYNDKARWIPFGTQTVDDPPQGTWRTAKRWAFEPWEFCDRCGFEHPQSEIAIEPHTGKKVCTRWPMDYDLPGREQLPTYKPSGIFY
jgi:hypothetical protein